MRWLVTFLVFFVAFPPHVYAAVITSSIGSGKDYATVTLWEADSYGATAADSAIGEVYGTITESSTVTLNDTTPTSIELTAASGEEHNGQVGTGAEISFTNNSGFVNSVGATISWLEFDGNGGGPINFFYTNSADNTTHHCIFHNFVGTTRVVYLRSDVQKIFYGNLIYNATTASGDLYVVQMFNTESSGSYISNNTITDIENTSASAGDDIWGIWGLDDTANVTLYNNLISDVVANAGTATNYQDGNFTTATEATNGSDDATATDSNYDNLTINFVGDPDFTPAETSDTNVKTGGTDEGASGYEDVSLDLTGRDRDAEGDTWSLGAIQYVSAGEPAARRIMLIQ